jgi:DNA-binding Lrp family transcriptional regulator
MATKAYVLVEAAVGKTRQVAIALRTLEGAQSVDPVTGPYDIIIVVEGTDLKAIGDLVTGRIHPISGVNRTVTCLVV